MNRRFKFRVWDLEKKEFTYSSSKQILIGLDGSIYDGNGCSYDQYFILQQFTGLLDKNKKEIYEGDLVKFNSEHELGFLGAESLAKYTSGEIKWISEGFNVCQKYCGRTILEEFATCDCHPCALEIIGNIMENKNE